MLTTCGRPGASDSFLGSLALDQAPWGQAKWAVYSRAKRPRESTFIDWDEASRRIDHTGMRRISQRAILAPTILVMAFSASWDALAQPRSLTAALRALQNHYSQGSVTLFCGVRFRKIDGPELISGYEKFQVALGEAPPDTIVVGSEPVGTATPTFVWNRASTAVRYRLLLRGEDWRLTTPFRKVTSLCEGTECSMTIEKPMPNGVYRWWAQADHRSGVRLEHIYPVSRMMKSVCGDQSRQDCRRTNERFQAMEKDVHNIFPVSDLISNLRDGRDFGEVEGEVDRVRGCDFEVDEDRGIAEPPDARKGNVARVMLYMQLRHDLPLTSEESALFSKWSRDDKITNGEVRRNQQLTRIQRNRNSFVPLPPR